MRVTEPQLRTLLLAQAIEQADTRHTLVSAVELQDATRSAMAAARARGLPRVGVAEVMLERATTIANHASGRDSTVAALHAPHAPHTQRPGTGGLGPWVARGLPLAALLLGLAIDRISNAHRVDLLSPPLLTVLAWNLAIYLLIAWRAMRPPQAHGAWLQQALRPLHHPFGRAERGRGLATRIAATFTSAGGPMRPTCCNSVLPGCCTCAPPPGARALRCRCCCAGWWCATSLAGRAPFSTPRRCTPSSRCCLRR